MNTGSLQSLESKVEKPFSSTLCVDLDGTLLATDLLWESVLILLKQQPWTIFSIIVWAVRGKAHLKRQLAQRTILDPATLPYRQEVLDFLHQHKEAGRTLILTTGSDRHPAEAIASYLGIFSEVLASDGVTNFSGRNKGTALEARFGKHGFDYIGDSRADLHVWPLAHASILVEPSKTVLDQAQAQASVKLVISNRNNRLTVFFRALRVHQWVKNVLLFLPLIAAHQVLNVGQVLDVCLAFLSFSLGASGLYIFNDLLDLPADRRHPKKKNRPFANGDLPLIHGFFLIPLLLSSAFLISVTTLPTTFASLLGLYAITTIGYSFFLKQVPIMDVLTLAGLYTLRVFAGGVAINVSISAWLLAFSMFIFLSLAFGKRHSELQFRNVTKNQGLERRGYIGVDKEVLEMMGIMNGYLSVLVLALYINSKDILDMYQHPQVLWLICPIMLYWISRTWLLAHRGSMSDDPLLLALKDPQSYSVAAAIGLLTLLAI